MDGSNWTPRYCGHSASNGGGTCHNNESQFYLPEQISISPNGSAVITTQRISVRPSLGTCLGSVCSFTSGRFDTQGKIAFQFGYFEARIKMPRGAGNWPALWMLGENITSVGWPTSGEIDIMEQWRAQIGRSSAATHFRDRAGGHRFDSGEINLNVDFAQDFHTYSLVWLPDKLEFYVDGILFFRENRLGSTNCNYISANVKNPNCTAQTDQWPFNAPHFLIFNNAVSDQSVNFNKWDGWESSQMEIDYVRFFQIESYGQVFKR